MEQDGSGLDQGDGLMQFPNITPLWDDIQLGFMDSFSRGGKEPKSYRSYQETIEFLVRIHD